MLLLFVNSVHTSDSQPVNRHLGESHHKSFSTSDKENDLITNVFDVDNS